MSGRRLRRAPAALLLIALVASLGVQPVVDRADVPGRRTSAVTRIEVDAAPAITTRSTVAARRAALPAAPLADLPRLAPPPVTRAADPQPVLRTPGRQFDARVASRAPPRS